MSQARTVTGVTSDAVPASIATSGLLRAGTDSALDPQQASYKKKRKPSKSKGAKQLSRSVTTPQMGGVSMSDSESDKKRNKLGYQRISIACAHCRRRKIRCLIADGDPQQRCSNCIRLKKDCVFYPVDQQSAMENRSQISTTTGVSSGPSSTVSASPPNDATDMNFDQVRDFSPFAPLPSNAPTTFQGLPLAPGSALPSQGGFTRPDFAYQQHRELQSHWTPAADFGGSDSEMMTSPVPPAHWQFGPPGAPGHPSPFRNDPTISTASVQQHPSSFDGDQRGGYGWQQEAPPARSMSYGNIEGHSGHMFPYRVPGSVELPTIPNSMRQVPTSLDIHNAATVSQATGPHSAPVEFQRHSGFGSPFLFQPSQHASNATQAPHTLYSNNWYGEPTNFEPLQEEQHGQSSAEADVRNLYSKRPS